MNDQFRPRALNQMERLDTHVPVIGPIKHTVHAESWLSKWLVKKLRQHGVLKEALPDMKIERAYIDPSEKSLLDRIMDAIHSSNLPMEQGNMRFVIGASDYHSEEFHDAFGFNAGPFGLMNNGQREIFGVPVQVVPWMKGWAVIPNKINEVE